MWPVGESYSIDGPHDLNVTGEGVEDKVASEIKLRISDLRPNTLSIMSHG